MTLILKALLALSLAAGGSLLSAQVRKSAPPDDQKGEKPGAVKLEGTYTIVSGEEGGKAIPEERIKGSVVRFTADRIVGTDKDRKEFFGATYTLDSGKTPWAIRMKSTTPKEAETTGLVKKEKDTLTVIYALPGGEAPKEFKTKENQQMFVLKPSDATDKKDKGPAKP